MHFIPPALIVAVPGRSEVNIIFTLISNLWSLISNAFLTQSQHIMRYYIVVTLTAITITE